MKRLIVAIACVLAAGEALAQSGGSPSNPLYQRRSQGNKIDQFQVTCVTDTALFSTSTYPNILSIYFQNMETTAAHRIGICPRVAAANGCNDSPDYAARVDTGLGWTTDVSASAVTGWSCDGDGGSYVLNVFIESWYDNDPRHPTPAAPTPIATPTPTPSPTPTPTP